MLTQHVHVSQSTPMIVLKGEIDVATVPPARQAIIDRIAIDADVIVDLRAVTFIDSTGLGMLVGGLKRAKAAGGQLRLVISGDRMLSVFQLTSLDRLFEFVEISEA